MNFGVCFGRNLGNSGEGMNEIASDQADTQAAANVPWPQQLQVRRKQAWASAVIAEDVPVVEFPVHKPDRLDVRAADRRDEPSSARW